MTIDDQYCCVCRLRFAKDEGRTIQSRYGPENQLLARKAWHKRCLAPTKDAPDYLQVPKEAYEDSLTEI